MSVQKVNINNVSMDYFLRGVDAAKPKGAPQVPQGAKDGRKPQLRLQEGRRRPGHGRTTRRDRTRACSASTWRRRRA